MDLDFLIRKSNNTNKKAGSIFMFHGYGSNKEDLFSLEQYLPQSHTIISLEAPLNYLLVGSHGLILITLMLLKIT